VITFFLVKDGDRLLRFVYANVSPEREKRLRTVASDVSDAITGYVFGNFLISVLAGLVTYVTLTILDVPFAVPLAILFAFFDLVPLVGATLGGIIVGLVVVIVGLVVAVVSFPVGLIVWAAVLIVYQQVENHVIQPLVYGRTTELHPLIVIVAILVGGGLLGVLGALIAIPAAATVQAVARDYWRFYRGRGAGGGPAEVGPVPPPRGPAAETAPG
jgi:predicted PurR-regulated permease PerM